MRNSRKRTNWLYLLLAGFLLVSMSFTVSLAEGEEDPPDPPVDECDDPGDHTICSTVCGDMIGCNTCCSKQYREKTKSSIKILETIKKSYYQSELDACKGNCLTDTNSNTNYVIIDPVNGASIGNYVMNRYSRPTEGGYQYTIEFATLPDLTIFVSDGLDATTFRGRVEFRDDADQWMALLTQDALPRIQVDTPAGTDLIVALEDAISSDGRDVFENAIAPYGSTFREQLEELVRMSDLEAPGFEGFGPLLKDLLGLGEL